MRRVSRIRALAVSALLVAGVTPYAYMGHAYLVGFVADPAHRARAVAIAGGVPGVRSVDAFLPVRASADHGVSRTASDLRLQGEVKTAIGIDRDERMTRVEVDVLDGHVVLLGVASSADAIASVQATAGDVPGVTGVTNFLLLPEPGSERLRPGLL